MSQRVLLLAGSSEAREIAALLSVDKAFDVTASFAGVTRLPAKLAVKTRSGGFGGVTGLCDYLRDTGTDVLIDATHPFAVNMTVSAAKAAKKMGLRHLIVQRPGWQPQRGDNWHFVDALEQAAALISKEATVFLGTGRQTLDSFANLADCRLICRQIDPPDRPFPYPNGRFQIGRPPFSIADEVAFFKAEGIDWLVVKNSGGGASHSKLDAARELGLPVILLRRQSLPDAPLVETEQACVAWLSKGA